MSSSDRGRDNTPGTQREPAPAGSPTGGADAYAIWLDRMQRARARLKERAPAADQLAEPSAPRARALLDYTHPHDLTLIVDRPQPAPDSRP